MNDRGHAGHTGLGGGLRGGERRAVGKILKVDRRIEELRREPLEVLRDRYELIEELGQGALGKTYLALDRQRSRRRVAIKELLPSRMKRWKDYDLFHRECQTLRHLSHAGIPSYVDDFVIESGAPGEPARLFLVQEFVEGRTLRDHLDEGETFGEEQVRNVAEQALEILRYLHGLNPPVIHRDIKPSNLMLDDRGRLVLVDFGAVREAVTAEGIGSTIVGTFGYMPPEQYAGKSTPGTDLFALGATLVELLSGRPPADLFEGIHSFRIPDDLPVTLGFERILLRMTDPELERRYDSAEAVLRDLKTGFLMVPTENLTGALPIPHEIRPSPRPFPGFYLRDAYTGSSHLGVVLLMALCVVMSLTLSVAAVLTDSLVWLAPGLFGVASVLAMAVAVSKKSRGEIDTYRRGLYTLGEITGRFLSQNSGMGAKLTYRYRLPDGSFRHGFLSTGDASYRGLTPGDPVGLIFLPEKPQEHVMFAVPQRWARRQVVNERKLLTAEADEGRALPQSKDAAS